MLRNHSIRTKMTLLTVFVIAVTIIVSMTIGIIAIKDVGNSTSDQMLLLLCKTGEKNLDSYFQSVEQSVETVSVFVDNDLKDHALDEGHIARSEDIFGKIAEKTNGVLTYYYRIDPSVSSSVQGFWYIYDKTKDSFSEHEVTQINLYDTENTSELVWFTVPKSTGKAVWLPSYITDNLEIDGHNVRVVSYNVPIYQNGVFVGVVGIEIDYNIIAEQVDNITLYKNGYAFVNDEAGNIVYHPKVDTLTLSAENKLVVPDGLLAEDEFLTYFYDGVEKRAVWLPLTNGMRLNVSVPISELNETWQNMICEIIIATIILLTGFSLLTTVFAKHITKPLRQLINAAEQIDAGNYDVKLDYAEDDEIGRLSKTFKKLVTHLKNYISDLNSMAYGDALTSVKNKGAFDLYVNNLQDIIDKKEEKIEFAVGVFDCNDLKTLNDRYGHEKGDIYLKNTTRLICRIFKSSPVFRIGGDEFAVILQNDDYMNREALKRRFEEKSEEICGLTSSPWEKVSVAVGIAEFEPESDLSVAEVIKRADKLMYQDKLNKKMSER